jgi:hypothetical protein
MAIAPELLAPPKPPWRLRPQLPLALPRSVYAALLEALCLAPNAELRKRRRPTSGQ